MTKSATIKNGGDNIAVGFNYHAIPADHREQLRSDAIAIRASLIAGAQSLIDAGEKLARWRDTLPHGAWLPWVEAETGMSEQWARDAINVFLRFRGNPMFLKDEGLALPQTALIRLAKAPEAAFEDVKGCLERGERLRVSDVTEIVKRHRETEKEGDEEVVLSKKRKAQVPSGPESLLAMSEKSRNELVSLVLVRLDKMLKVIEEAEAGKPRKGDLEKKLRPEAQWLTDALEQLTQRRAATNTKFVHKTFLERPPYDPGPWAAAAVFLHDIAYLSTWERTPAAELPELLRVGKKSLRAVLSLED